MEGEALYSKESVGRWLTGFLKHLPFNPSYFISGQGTEMKFFVKEIIWWNTHVRCYQSVGRWAPILKKKILPEE